MNYKLNKIVNPFLKWYEKNKRSLPWREDLNPYHVWVSEIMLQQTRIEAVKKYYTRFMKKLPTIQDLSEISEEELLKLWEGLGYYTRAKNLQKAAIQIVTEYDGIMPKTYHELLQLAGIGEYTAGAIASICYNEKIPAVDGNVLRVIARITGNTKNVLLPETKKEITNQIKEILPKQAGNFNQALMELGEIICLLNGTPLCKKCPLHEQCIAYQKKLTSQIPVRIKNIKRKKEEKTVFILLTKDYQLAIEKRTGKGLLSGMYQLPNVQGLLNNREIESTLEQWHLKIDTLYSSKEIKHVFTHIDWNMQGYYLKVVQKNNLFEWISLPELSTKYPLPTAFQKFIRYIPILTEI